MNSILKLIQNQGKITILDIVYIAIETIIFLILITFIFKMIQLYFENITLQQDKAKNQQAIEEKEKQIHVIIKRFIRMAAILFVLLIVFRIVIGILYE